MLKNLSANIRKMKINNSVNKTFIMQYTFQNKLLILYEFKLFIISDFRLLRIISKLIKKIPFCRTKRDLN
jgi:hypothetical protein